MKKIIIALFVLALLASSYSSAKADDIIVTRIVCDNIYPFSNMLANIYSNANQNGVATIHTCHSVSIERSKLISSGLFMWEYRCGGNYTYIVEGMVPQYHYSVPNIKNCVTTPIVKYGYRYYTMLNGDYTEYYFYK